jgi:hypothetical protein
LLLLTILYIYNRHADLPYSRDLAIRLTRKPEIYSCFATCRRLKLIRDVAMYSTTHAPSSALSTSPSYVALSSSSGGHVSGRMHGTPAQAILCQVRGSHTPWGIITTTM